MAIATKYPFDPTGSRGASRILSEQHVITSVNFRAYHYLIPNFAPFFEGAFNIKAQFPDGTNRKLVYGVDYYFSNQFLDASRACAKPVYGSISFLDTDFSGIVTIDYNTVGGMWNISLAEITRILAEEMRNPRITAWEQITQLPQRFPVIDHEWDLVDMVGMSKVVDELNGIHDAILSANGGGLAEHVNNYSNPHNVNKTQVGLGNVQNYAIATQPEAEAGTANDRYMTPLAVKFAISKQVGDVVGVHANRTDNPHQVTKTQVGLSNVQNFGLASKTDAENGAIDTAYMTPLKTSQAIAALVGNNYNIHAARTDNPHGVTKDQVGLFNVQNYPVASQQDAIAGTANDKYMTPLRTQQQIVQYLSVQLDGHATRTDNPHQTTASQVGLGNVKNFDIATQEEAQLGQSNSAYMTPGRTQDAIKAQAAPIAHVSDTLNPHKVTADQVDSYTRGQTDNLLGQKVGKTDQWVGGMSSDDFVAKVLQGKAAEAGHADDSAKLEGRTYAEVVTDVGQTLATKYAVNEHLYSRDKSATANPGATPNRWVQVGKVSVFPANASGSENPIAVTYPDAYWFVTGGAAQAADDNAQRGVSSACYLMHARCAVSSNVLEVTRLNNVPDTDVKFGYTYDNASQMMTIWAKLSAGYTDLQATQLTALGNEIIFSDSDVFVEPTGITYATVSGIASDTSVTALAKRVSDIETVLNSITVV